MIIPSLELKPNSKQQEFFLSLPAGEDGFWEAFYGGEAGSGKTFTIVNLPLFMKCHEIYGFQGTIYRRSYPQIEESLVPESRKWYPRFGFQYNESNHVWRHPKTKAEIRFGFLEHEKDALKHDSAQYHYLAFEELTQFTEFMYKYLLHRCRSDIAGWKPLCRSVGTPGDIGNSWVKKRFVYPAREGFKPIEYLLPSGRLGRRIFIKAHREDNIDLLRNDPSYGDRLELLPSEALKRAKKYGDWDAFQGQVFTEFRDFKHPDEPDNALHVIEPFAIPEWWPKIIAIDWGFVHPNWVGWGAVSPNGEIVIYREYMVTQTKIKEWGPVARRLSQNDGYIARVVCDPSAFRDISADQTLAEQIADATGWNLEPADNDRIGGKLLLHELMRWENAPSNFTPSEGFDVEFANKLRRIHGEEAYVEYCSLFFPPVTNEVIPRFKIFNTCPELIECLKTVVYNEAGKKSNINEEDVMKVKGDDPYDGVRYLAKAFERFTAEASEEFAQRARIQEAMENVQSTGDYNRFYRVMEIMEEEEKTPTNTRYRPIKRHSRFVH